MTAEELVQVRQTLVGRKVCVINLAAFSMAVGSVSDVATDTGKVNLNLDTDKGDAAGFSLPAPVKTVSTPTGYRFESEQLVLQVDFMPD